jgi:hypothetical protein
VVALVYATCSYLERKSQTLEGVKRMSPYVDYCIIQAPEKEEDWKELKEFKNALYAQEEWVDNFPYYRNKLLEWCRAIQVDDVKWVIASDPDETYCEEFAKDCPKVVVWAERNEANCLLINSHDILYEKDGSKKETVSNFFKPLIFKLNDLVHYVGSGSMPSLHEALAGVDRKITLPRKYYYVHSKYWWEVWERAARNVYVSGGGDSIGRGNPEWPILREICASLNLLNWSQVREYLRKGNIDRRLKDWLVRNAKEGLNFEHEMLFFGRFYFEYLHPEEAKEARWNPIYDKTPLAKAMDLAERKFIEVLGYHGSWDMKMALAKDLANGTIKEEEIDKVLREKYPPSEP